MSYKCISLYILLPPQFCVLIRYFGLQAVHVTTPLVACALPVEHWYGIRTHRLPGPNVYPEVHWPEVHCPATVHDLQFEAQATQSFAVPPVYPDLH